MRRIDPNTFKIRCSAISQIMAGTVGLSDSQKSNYKKLSERKADVNAKPLTAKMEADLEKLEYIKKNPELPQGAKTYCQNWVISQSTGRKKHFTSKETEKGNLMERWAMEFVGDHFDIIIPPNGKFAETEWIKGTNDSHTGNDVVRDIKCPWDVFTFPYFETKPNPVYYWQLQGYMSTTGCKRAELIYVLADTPEYLIEQAARRDAYNKGDGEISLELYGQYYQRMTYGDLAPADRIKVFHIERDDEAIQKINERVELCREYIAELCNKR